MKTKKEKQSMIDIDDCMNITIESINRQKIEAVLELSKAINNLSKVLSEDDVNIIIKDCNFNGNDNTKAPLLNIQTKID